MGFKRLIYIFIFSFLIFNFQYSFGQEDKEDVEKVKKKKNKGKLKKLFVDTTDNAFDVSTYVRNSGGFIPVPLLITEPAVGFGGGAAGIFVHNQKRKRA